MPGMSLSNPYEVMAQTMAKSRESAVQPKVSDGPLFATLTPEAVAFATKGIAPLMKAVDNVYLSERVRSEAVRAIDNIPPGAIPYMKVLDTPGDAGGSITVYLGEVSGRPHGDHFGRTGCRRSDLHDCRC